MRLLLDSNIVLDCLCSREPFCVSANKLFLLGRLGEVELWFSSAQTNDIFYTATHGGKKTFAAQAKREIREFCKVVHVCGIGEAEFQAVLDSTWDDIEDACVYQAAVKVKADAIVTRNQRDFEKSPIRVFDCDEFFEYMAEEKGITYGEIFL